MAFRFMIAILMLATWSRAFGVTEAPPLLMKSEFNGEFLGRHLITRMGVDTETLQDAIRSESYEYMNRDVPSYGLTGGWSVAWARAEIINPTSSPITVFFENFVPAELMSLTLMQNDQVIQEASLGRQTGFKSFPIHYRAAVFELNIPPGKSTLYARQYYTAQYFDLRLWSPRPFFNAKLAEYALIGGLFMVLGAMFVYNLMLYFILRIRYYLYYLLYLLSYIAMESSILGYPTQYLPRVYGEIVSNTGFWFGVAVLGSILFCRDFLETKAKTPKMDLALRVIALACIVHSALLLLTMNFFMYSMVLVMTAPFLMISVGILRVIQGYRPARFYLLAWTFFMCGSSLYFLSLSLGIGTGGFLVTWLIRISSVVEAVLFSLALADKVHQKDLSARAHILSLNEQLRHHILNIESIVAEKTRKIKSILDNIKLGLFTIQGDGRIDAEYSLFLEGILQKKNIEGEGAVELLLGQSQTTSDEESQVRSALVSTIGEDPLAFEFNQDIFPHEIHRVSDIGLSKILEADWVPIVSPAGVTERVLVVLRDVTDDRNMEDRNRQQEEKLALLAELMDIPGLSFDRFMSQSQRCLEKLQALMPELLRSVPLAVGTAFIDVHTLKGLSRSLGLRRMTDVIHRLEHELSVLREGQACSDEPVLQHLVTELSLLAARYQGFQETYLHRKSQVDQVGIDRETVAWLLRYLQKNPPKTDGEFSDSYLRVQELLDHAAHTDIQGLMDEIQMNIAQLGKDLQKPNPQLHVEGAAGLRLPTKLELALRDVFLHVIRNCMDHGIESPAEREAKAKPRAGLISLVWKQGESSLIVEVSDDGRGLDLQQIRAHADKRGLLSLGQMLSEEQCAELIFHPGLSTAQEISEISGRGVGMHAVRIMLERLGGSIAVKPLSASRFGRVPFMLQIELPLEPWIMEGAA